MPRLLPTRISRAVSERLSGTFAMEHGGARRRWKARATAWRLAQVRPPEPIEEHLLFRTGCRSRSPHRPTLPAPITLPQAAVGDGRARGGSIASVALTSPPPSETPRGARTRAGPARRIASGRDRDRTGRRLRRWTRHGTRPLDAAGREGASGGRRRRSRVRRERRRRGVRGNASERRCIRDTVKVTIQADLAARKPSRRSSRRCFGSAACSGLRRPQREPASSAPISALYTASYELEKRRLEPMFPAEKAWVAHCLAGGAPAWPPRSCTRRPSVKQRCQVSHGAVTVLGATRAIVAEGVFGLYKGWTAVLCRNIRSRRQILRLRAPSAWQAKPRAEARRRPSERRRRRPRSRRRARGLHRRAVHHPVRHDQDETADAGRRRRSGGGAGGCC